MLNDLVTENTFFGTSVGMEAAATVVRTGDGVTDLEVADRIVASISKGCMQSFITVPADRLFWAPALPGFNHVDLAALPVAFITALYCLRDVGRLQPGERVLLHSATGGVGLAAIQVARQIGAEIFATAGSEEKRDYLRSLGIQHVMDSRSLDFADRILERTDGQGVDVVLNFLTGEALEKNLACLAPYGRLIEIGKRDIAENNGLPLRPFNRNLMFASVDVDRLLAERPAEARRLFLDIWQYLEAGDYRPLPMRVFPIAELADACRLLMQAKHIGKVVVSLMDQEVPVVPLQSEAALFRSDASYLITGGFGGFGLEVARWMVGQGARHLVLAGRSGAATPEARAAVQALEEAGVTVRAAAVDIADEASVQALLAEIAMTLPPLRGVMHAAMVLDDAMLVHLERDRLARVFAPKAAGAWLLHRLTRDLPLDHFVLFSSVSALFGNPGQGSYVAANAFLDALAHHRRCLGLPATSVNWGMLAEIGVAARDSSVAQHLERIGITGLTPRQAVEGLGRILHDDPVQVGLMHVDWQRWGQVNPMARKWTRFAHLIGEAGQTNSALDELKEVLIAATPDEREAALTALLAEEIAKVLRIPAAKLDLHEPLSRIGVDSLTTTELQMVIQSLFQIELSALELMRGVSVAQLARQILEKLKLADAAAIPPASTDADPSESPPADQNATNARVTV
jgi:NADPH:quinone reductase-like Zn-dependent oxidoreductase/NAD(P)-dependent dehydrogenase (short-subunit alcohol dehydrogenase family)/acyl carrier protein